MITSNSESKALYTNIKGAEVTHGSYSSRQTFKKCPREFQLERIEGWSDKVKRAAPLFGTALESAIKEYEANGRPPLTCPAIFERLWQQVQTTPDFKELVYTESEGDWESLLRAGKEMCLLYEIRAPYLPISVTPAAVWSQNMRKKIFPGTELDKLENKAVFDIISWPAWNHPMLPAAPVDMDCHECNTRWSCALETDGPVFTPCKQHATRSLIIDMKTSGEDLNTELVGLDPQLAEYAWQGRVPDVAFLWFVKKGHGYKKASRVTLLHDAAPHKAGFELIVLWVDDAKGMVYLGNHAVFNEYEQLAKGITGNALKNFKLNYIATPGVFAATPAAFTKQRLQFGAARLTDQQIDDTGRSVAQTTVEMVRAHREGFYPQLAGIRFPNQKCNFCAMRHICLNQPEKRDQFLTKRGEEWLDGNADTEKDAE